MRLGLHMKGGEGSCISLPSITDTRKHALSSMATAAAAASMQVMGTHCLHAGRWMSILLGALKREV